MLQPKGSNSIGNAPSTYADKAIRLQMPLVRMLKRRVSWSCMNDITDAMSQIASAARSLDDETNLYNDCESDNSETVEG